MTDFYLITGFLGAGKTTLLQKLLRLFPARKTAVIVNEFGSQGVDGALLAPTGAAVTQIEGGSIFCSCRLDRFEEALAEVLAHRPEVVFVEASGLSDPGGIRRILAQPAFEAVAYKGSLCVMDAANAHKVLATVAVAKKQLAAAGLVLINKADLVDGNALERLKEQVLALRPGAPLHTTSFGAIDPAWLKALDAPAAGEGPPAHTRDLGLQKKLVRFGAISRYQLEKFIAMFAEDTHRVKGFVRCTDGLFYVDGVGAEVAVTPSGRAEESLPEGLTVLAGANLPMQKSLAAAVRWYEGQIEAVE